MKFSVLMSIYFKDNPEYLQLAMKSVWDNQTLKPNEIVLVKDGPLGKHLDAVVGHWKRKLGSVLKVVSLSKNVGLGEALNAGLKYCNYNLVARMDADDISLPERFSRQINFFRANSKVDILGGWGLIINEYGKVKSKRTQPANDKDIKKILWSCPIIHVSVMFKRDSILRVGSYNAKVAWRQEDYELWIRAGFYGLIFNNIQDYLIKYRVNLKKNTISVGYNRSKIGYKAVRKFDPRFSSYIAVMYPFIRSLLPFNLSYKLENYVSNSRFDPRRGIIK